MSTVLYYNALVFYTFCIISAEDETMFRLRELREENGIRRSTLARELGINAGTIANYENELRQAPYEYLLLFADYFDVSVDYLLGKEERERVAVRLDGALTETERKLIDDYRACSPTGKSRIGEFAALWRERGV